MKIALISPTFPPHGASGIGSYCMHHAAGLAARGHDVEVFTWLDTGSGSEGFLPGVSVRRIPDYAFVSALCRVTNALWRSVCRIAERDPHLSTWGFVRDLRGSLTLALVFLLRYRNTFEVIETPEWGATGAFLHLVARRSVRVVKCHASDYSHAVNYRPFFRVARLDVLGANMLERLSLYHAHAVMSPSRALLPDIRDNLGFTGTVHLLPNEINREVCCQLRKQALQGAADPRVAAESAPGTRPFTLFSSGRLDQLKGLDTIKRVLSLLSGGPIPSARFVFAGDAGPHAARELASLESDRLTVTVLGAVSQEVVFGNLLMSDVFFFPSWTENCPMAVLEAMALGIPILASNVGGIPELIRHDQNGLLCGRDQPGDFAAQIVRLYKDPALRKRLVENARDVVDREFGFPGQTEKWLDIVRHAEAGSGRTDG
jgi:glycosyltransferase involved in cell wall biosynthesis